MFGPRSYEVGVNLAGLAGVDAARGQHAAAEDGYRRALAIHRRLFGAHHVEVALTLNDLAMLVAARGRRVEALRLGRRALVAFNATCGPRHPSTRACAENVARLQAWRPAWPTIGAVPKAARNLRNLSGGTEQIV